MPGRHKTRELALQVLFVWDAHGQRDDDMARQVVKEPHHVEDDAMRSRAIELAASAWENREAADAWVERLAPQWPVRRQPGVDRNILRLA
ncbi:MAG: transcription antitermination factor NusB, partial [Tepidisphaeraceae bacterium]